MLRATKWLTGLSRSNTNNSETSDSTVTPHSLDQLKILYRLLEKNQKVSENNRTLLVETLRQIAEILIWGDQNDSSVFDFFLEKNMLYFFLNIMKQKCGGYVCTQLLQTLNILFENIKNETSLYYLLSNNHVNSIIIHKFDFSDEEVMAYYISFLKTLSLKLNGHTIHFFFNEHTADFPLYTEAIKFFNHPEKMVRIAVRTLTLNVFRVQEVAMLRFIRECTAAPYFSNLSWFIGKHIVDLNTSLMNYLESRHNQTSQSNNSNLINRLEDLVAEHLDHLHYLNDILLLNIDDLNVVLSDNLLYRLIIPLYVLSFLNIDDRFKNKQIKTVLSPTVAIFLLTQSFLILSYGTLLNTLILSLISTQNDIETISRKWEFTQPVQSLEVAIEQAIMTTSNQNSSVSNEARPGSAVPVEKKCSLAKHVQNDEIKQDQTLTSNNPSLDWRDKSFLVTLLAALNAEICPKTTDDTYGHVRERSESKATINKQQDGAKKEKNQLYLTCHSANTLNLIPDWTSSDDRIILFTLSLISAIISNEAIKKQTHENFFSPGNIAPKECPESYFNTLINSLLLIMRQCSLPNSSIRLITFELAVHLFRKLILISGDDDENKNNNLNENLLSDHQIAVLEQAREDSSHVLRQYYCSIDKSVFLNLFEREARIFFNNSANKQATNHPVSSPSSSSSSTSATSKSNIWSYNSSMTLEQHFMDAKLLLPPPEINLDDCNFHLRLPGMDYEKARYIIQVFFVLRLLSFDVRKIMGDDQIQEKIDDFSILLDDPSTSKLISMDHFIDLENCDLNSCSVAFYHPINQLRRSSTRRDRFSNSKQSSSAESSLSMLASGKKMPQFMAIVSELLILIEPDDKRYGWGIIRFIARLQDIEKIVIHAKDIGHVCTPPLPDKDDNRSLYIYFNNYNLSTHLIENKNNTRLKKPQISESIVARFQFNDTVRSLVARNNLSKAHKKVLDRKILSVANLIDIPNHVNEVRASSGASSTTRSGKSDNNKKSNNNQQHQVLGRTFAVPGGAVPSKYQSEPTNVNMANKVNVDINNINNKKRYAYPPPGYVVSSNRIKQPTSANMKASIENERKRKKKIKLPSSNPGDYSQEEFGIPLNDLSPNTIRKNGCNNNIANDIGTTTTTTTNTFIETNHADDDCEFSKEGEIVDGKSNNNNNQSTNNTNNTNNNSDKPNEIINNEKNKGKSTNLVAKSTASLVTGITKTKNTAGFNRSETFDV